ncbi:MAG TPA: hypothetical protein VMU34_24135 [Mycobacterium sp.]|nr:hypothetical protein [Mycobacterium sp.]
MSQPDELTQVWRALVQVEELPEGSWRAWYAGCDWSVTGPAQDDAVDQAVGEAIRRGEDPDAVVRAAQRAPVQPEPDDPRLAWVWRFMPQAEQVGDGTWRAWYPSGGWLVTGASEDEAKDKAFRESIRCRDDPDEVARKVAIMRRHLVQPVPGVSNFDKSVLESAWQSDNPAEAVRQILDSLGEQPPGEAGA